MSFIKTVNFQKHYSVPILMVVIACFTTACVQQNSGENIVKGQIAPLLEGMGNHHFEISTEDTLAQEFFNQGLVLSYGFNHKEAHRTFQQVAKLDPDNPMAWWGAALVLGPNINSGMSDENIPRAWQALKKAEKLKGNGTQKEQAFIEALSHRYAKNPPTDRAALDSAYASAMSSLVQKYPDDLDAQTLYAEALMNLHPWNYWKPNGDPQPWTPEILRVLESVIQRAPNHPGANHLYIHAVEAEQPQKALNSANTLRELVPGAGHLVHMPSHIYIRTGNYHAGTLANERAVKADNEYVTQCRQQGIYPLAYVPHNYHFLWATATMEGRSARSLEAAQSTSRLIDTETMRQPGLGTLQHYWVIPLYDHVRFGRWQEILSYPKPAKDLVYPRGVWHYARGIAYLGTGDVSLAQQELVELQTIAADDTLREITIWDINTTHQLMQIAGKVLQAELLSRQGSYNKSIDLFEEAIKIENQLNYNEPPDWFFPVRHSLGAVLLKADRPKEAEKIYREDLKKFPKNGWSLYGLWQSLEAQGQTTEAVKAKKQFQEAWKFADVKLTASRIL